MRLACAGLYGQINFVSVCTGASRERQKRCAFAGGSASQGRGSALQPSQSRMLAAAAAGFEAQLCILCENKVGRETLPVLVALTWEFDNDVYFKIQTNLKPLHHRYTYSFL